MQVITEEVISVHTSLSAASTLVNVLFLYSQVFDWTTRTCLCFSHRPVDVYNVYNQVQVKMLMKEDDCENIPAFEDVFRDDEDEQEEEAEAGFAGTL